MCIINQPRNPTEKYNVALRLSGLHKYQEQTAGNYATLCNLITDKVMSQQTAKNIAGSGLRYQHLVTVYQRGCDAALTHLLSERTCGLPRVKGSTKVLGSINNHFRNAGSN